MLIFHGYCDKLSDCSSHEFALNLWCEERFVQGQPFQWRSQGQVDIPNDDVTPKKTWE